MRSGRHELVFPVGGLDEDLAFQQQPPFSTPSALNVRGRDPETGRLRGGSRPGLTHYTGGGATQDINHVTIAESGSSQVGSRKTTLVVISGGSGGLGNAFTIFSATLNGKIWYVDGVNKRVYDASSDSFGNWAAQTPGTFPHNGTALPTLIERYRGSVILSGLVGDDHNWFISAVGDATDFDYFKEPRAETNAVAGNNSETGLVGDVVRTMIPYRDDALIFGCDASIWILSAHPRAGGRIDLLTDGVGMPWGRPWCINPDGIIYFMASTGAIYELVPDADARPRKISSPTLDERLVDVDLSKTIPRLMWNERETGIHVFVTTTDGVNQTHWFYDLRADAWWPDQFASASLQPRCVHTFDGDGTNDRAPLVGTGQGVFKWDPGVSSDNGASFSSHVDLGPFKLGGAMQSATLTELQGVLAKGSGEVTYALRVGDSAEDAFEAGTFYDGTWSAGRNPSEVQRAHGDAMFLRLSATGRWAYETAYVRLRETGPARQRAF